MRREISPAITQMRPAFSPVARALSSPCVYTEPLVLHRGVKIRPVPDRLDAGIGGDGRAREVRLAGAQIDHIVPGRTAALRLLRDRDGGGRFEVLEVGGEAVAHGVESLAAATHARLSPTCARQYR